MKFTDNTALGGENAPLYIVGFLESGFMFVMAVLVHIYKRIASGEVEEIKKAAIILPVRTGSENSDTKSTKT